MGSCLHSLRSEKCAQSLLLVSVKEECRYCIVVGCQTSQMVCKNLVVALFNRWLSRMMHINIFGIFIALFVCFSDVSNQRRECLGNSNYCPGQLGAMGSICRHGYCVCTGQGYDYVTCLRKLFCFVLLSWQNM